MNTIQPIPPQLRPYFKTKFDKINWVDMSRNPSPGAIKLLEQNFDKICWYELSSNPSPGAIKLLEANPDKIRWSSLSYNSNPDAIKLIETNPSHEEIKWSGLSSNPHAIKLLEANQDKIDWEQLSSNPKARELLLANRDKVNWQLYNYHGGPGSTTTLTWDDMTEDDLQIVNISWRLLSILKSCPSPAWLAKLEQNIDKLDWWKLSGNDNDHIMHILDQNVDKIKWEELSTNTNPRAIRILEQNPDKIDWFYLALNPAACDLISKNPDKIDWFRLSSNPSPDAIPLIERTLKVLDDTDICYPYWPYLTKNPLAVNILKRNPTKICWSTAPAELFDVVPCPKIHWDYSSDANIKRRRRHFRRCFRNWSVYNINKTEEEERLHVLSEKYDVWKNPNIFVDVQGECIVCYDSTTTQTPCCLQPLCAACNKICKNSCKSCPMCRALSKTSLRLQQLKAEKDELFEQLYELTREEKALQRLYALEN